MSSNWTILQYVVRYSEWILRITTFYSSEQLMVWLDGQPLHFTNKTAHPVLAGAMRSYVEPVQQNLHRLELT